MKLLTQLLRRCTVYAHALVHVCKAIGSTQSYTFCRTNFNEWFWFFADAHEVCAIDPLPTSPSAPLHFVSHYNSSFCFTVLAGDDQPPKKHVMVEMRANGNLIAYDMIVVARIRFSSRLLRMSEALSIFVCYTFCWMFEVCRCPLMCFHRRCRHI